MKLPVIKHLTQFIEVNDEDYIVETLETLEALTEVPSLKDEELDVVLNAIVALSKKHQEWVKDYQYDLKTNEFTYRFDNELDIHQMVKGWFLK